MSDDIRCLSLNPKTKNEPVFIQKENIVAVERDADDPGNFLIVYTKDNREFSYALSDDNNEEEQEYLIAFSVFNVSSVFTSRNNRKPPTASTSKYDNYLGVKGRFFSNATASYYARNFVFPIRDESAPISVKHPYVIERVPREVKDNMKAVTYQSYKQRVNNFTRRVQGLQSDLSSPKVLKAFLGGEKDGKYVLSENLKGLVGSAQKIRILQAKDGLKGKAKKEKAAEVAKHYNNIINQAAKDLKAYDKSSSEQKQAIVVHYQQLLGSLAEEKITHYRTATNAVMAMYEASNSQFRLETSQGDYTIVNTYTGEEKNTDPTAILTRILQIVGEIEGGGQAKIAYYRPTYDGLLPEYFRQSKGKLSSRGELHHHLMFLPVDEQGRAIVNLEVDKEYPINAKGNIKFQSQTADQCNRIYIMVPNSIYTAESKEIMYPLVGLKLSDTLLVPDKNSGTKEATVHEIVTSKGMKYSFKIARSKHLRAQALRELVKIDPSVKAMSDEERKQSLDAWLSNNRDLKTQVETEWQVHLKDLIEGKVTTIDVGIGTEMRCTHEIVRNELANAIRQYVALDELLPAFHELTKNLSSNQVTNIQTAAVKKYQEDALEAYSSLVNTERDKEYYSSVMGIPYQPSANYQNKTDAFKESVRRYGTFIDIL